jgi:hypothetical protein
MADVIVTRDGGSGAGAGVIIGVLIAILVVGIAIWYFGFSAPSRTTNINVAPPQVNVQNPQPASS